MISTGMVRRVDDLGRVVIPKEIRRELRLKEMTPMEIFVDKSRHQVIFQRYTPIGEHDWDTACKLLKVWCPEEVKFALYDRYGEQRATNDSAAFQDYAKIDDDLWEVDGRLMPIRVEEDVEGQLFLQNNFSTDLHKTMVRMIETLWKEE